MMLFKPLSGVEVRGFWAMDGLKGGPSSGTMISFIAPPFCRNSLSIQTADCNVLKQLT